MTKEEEIILLKKMIAEADVKEALERVVASNNFAYCKDDVLSLQYRYNEIKKSSIRGTIGFEKANIEKNKIVSSLLLLMEGKNETKSKKNFNKNKYIYWSIGFAIVLLIYLTRANNNNVINNEKGEINIENKGVIGTNQGVINVITNIQSTPKVKKLEEYHANRLCPPFSYNSMIDLLGKPDDETLGTEHNEYNYDLENCRIEFFADSKDSMIIITNIEPKQGHVVPIQLYSGGELKDLTFKLGSMTMNDVLNINRRLSPESELPEIIFSGGCGAHEQLFIDVSMYVVIDFEKGNHWWGKKVGDFACNFKFVSFPEYDSCFDELTDDTKVDEFSKGKYPFIFEEQESYFQIGENKYKKIQPIVLKDKIEYIQMYSSNIPINKINLLKNPSARY